MRAWLCSFGLLAAVVLAMAYRSHAQTKSTKSEKPSVAKKDPNDSVRTDSSTQPGGARPATLKVQKGPIKVEVSLRGMFESDEMTEIAIRPESWSNFTVLKAVEHGSAVKRGDTLVTLDMEKIDQSIKELEAELQMADLTLKQAAEELGILEKSNPIEMASAERTKKQTDEDFRRWSEVERPMYERNVIFSLKSARHNLEYAREELKQLEKMYRASDLREETEEIILKRQRHWVEFAENNLKNAESRTDFILKTDLPRQDQQMKDLVARGEFTLQRSRITLPITLSQKRLALERSRYDREKSSEKLRKIRKDREAMLLRSPVDGIAYYGKCVRGQWTTASMVASRLQRGGSLSGDEVFMTIVNPRPLFVRATVDEKDLQHVRAGLKGKVSPTSTPNVKVPALIEQVSTIPLTSGSFEARIRLQVSTTMPGLMPGMTCTVNLIPYFRPDALSLSSTAVFAEDTDDEQRFVYVMGKDNKAVKRAVKVGKTSGAKLEIVDGLKENEEVLQERPAGVK